MRVFAPHSVATDALSGKHHPVVNRSLPAPVAPVSAMHSDGALLHRKSNCACGGGCPSCAEQKQPETIQTKLQVSTPGDQYEQEADQVAKQVMRAPASTDTPVAEMKGSNNLNVSRHSLRGSSHSHDAPAVVPEVLRSTGELLDGSTRSFMESRFGHDFAPVRVHADNNAAEMASMFNASAFTVGNDIYFGSRQYAPGSFSGDKLLAHELTHTIQQSRGGSHAVRGSLDGAAPISLSFAPSSIQRKEAVLAPSVTPENPLERLLKEESDGLTTPFVNGVQITDTAKLDDALPSKLSYGAGSAANTCKVDTPIDINSQAKIITASAPGPDGWPASAPFATLKKVLGITDKDCAAKKGDIKVRMVAKIGNKAYATLVRTAEGDHEKVLKENHNNYLKPYHDLVNSKVGSDKDLRKCAEGLSKDFRANEEAAISNWATDWQTSITKLDGPSGPHTSSASTKMVGKCDEVLVTIQR